MKNPFRDRSWRSVGFEVALASLMLSSPGCGVESSPTGSPGEEAEHAGHVIPAHKPKTFPEAVRRLRELNDHFKAEAASSRPDPREVEIAFDIARWLPEIAADSEMPEREWNEVNAHADLLAARYAQILARPSVQADQIAGADVEIGCLDQTLHSSEPRWFSGTNQKAASR